MKLRKFPVPNIPSKLPIRVVSRLMGKTNYATSVISRPKRVKHFKDLNPKDPDDELSVRKLVSHRVPHLSTQGQKAAPLNGTQKLRAGSMKKV
ncbi:hypothetical protein ILUMI_01644 [Ignelater luminosus]|uniref:Uncharacterized protein n=1 Tax=Ignelater luminosus TaxID=2038154 RepID=A0A8K0GM19_IGNLU|nr:hypothetical protein ILUMI_01644 [Ignelater luminosus]